MSRYETFDRRRLHLRPVAERGHDFHHAECRPLVPPDVPYEHDEFPLLIEAIHQARQRGAARILFLGAHPIKVGMSRYLVDLIDRGLFTHVATNGAGIIHDFELATLGGTTESVARWIRQGQFGLWQETSRLNDLIADAARRGEGIGEAVGRTLVEENPPHGDLSLCAAGYRAGVPVTSHVGIGSDIIHSHANCDGAALGAASYTDFLIFTRAVEQLEGGVFLNFGSAVAGPEVYLKALSMARNVAHPEGREIRHFTTAMFDLMALPPNFREGTPGKEHPQYYFRPWKTILVRTVADGGTSYYFRGDHQQTIPTLWHQLVGC
jgi:hypothetical protein